MSLNDSVYSRAVREELSPPKISDSTSKVVTDLVTATLHQFDRLNFTKNALRFNLRATNVQNCTHYCGDDLFLLFNSNWTGQLGIVDFSVVTPYIPDSPPKEKT